ncbi:MAG TPA: hypothetical protein VGH54_29985 [Mycobacterium sp.]|jgi:hypothetical protein|uniref:hypothetical protein n=1 Tax=Mycobacterium sp. TaxID=1785 RepID=UPI002F3F5CAA
MNWYWGIWASVSFSAFAIPEMIAVFTGHPRWKLSSAVWSLEDAFPYPLVWRTVAVITVAVIAYHLAFGPRH